MTKKKSLIIFFLILVLIGARSGYCQKQSVKEDIYLEFLWDNIDIVGTEEIPVASDTMVVLCTIRTFDLTSRQKFGNEIDTSGAMRYLLALRNSGRWKLYPMSSMKAAASYLPPNKDLVFYIEGMGKTFTVNLYRAAGLSLQYNTNVIVFDYPSVHPEASLIRNFKIARQNSTGAYNSYVQFLKTIQENKKDSVLWMQHNRTTLFHHSMGNRMLQKAVLTNSLTGIQNSLVNTLVLNAACVDQKHHKAWIDQIHFANQIIVHYNKKDMQLKGAMLLTFRKQLGAKVGKPYSNRVQYVDFNKLAGRQHNLFLSRPGSPGIPLRAKAYYEMLFHVQEIDWESSTFFGHKKKQPGVYLIQ